VEHRFTDTEDETVAGAWWAPSATLPELAWLYDAQRQMLTVTTKAGRTTEHRLIGNRHFGEHARRTFLPSLALHLSRRVKQPRD
jgi:hypothetical protein